MGYVGTAVLFILLMCSSLSCAQKTITIQSVGLETPESIVHDEVADLYLVSNINGDGLAVDDNGFVSRLSPEGEVLDLKWISGEAEGTDLNAPKGMAIVGDTLYIADITAVRMFDRESGEPKGFVEVEGSSFLNDVAAAQDGAVYVTDSGLTASTDAIYRITPEGQVETVIEGSELSQPNGLTVLSPEKLFVVAYSDSGKVYIVRNGKIENVQELGVNQFDGVVILPDGDRLISSWGASSVVRLLPDGGLLTILDEVNAPADIGYDAKRGRLLIPLFRDDKVLMHILD